MSRRSVVAVGLACLLAACGDPVEWSCVGGEPETEGALVTATIDGDPFVAARGPYVWPAYLDPEEGRFSLNASTTHGITSEEIQISIEGYAGPGAYPIGAAAPPYASFAIYYCEAGDQGQVLSTGAPGDTLWIDSVAMGPMVVAGRFVFHGVGKLDSLPHAIENGTFRVAVHLAN